MHEAVRHAGIAGVDDRTLPLDEHEVRLTRRLEHEVLGGTGDEVGDDGVHGDPSPLDQNAGLAGGGEGGADPLGANRVEDLKLRRHLADVAIGADGEDDGRVDVAHAAARHLEPRGRTTEIVDRDAMLGGERRQLRDIGDEGVQAAPDLEAVLDRAGEQQDPLGGQLAPGGSDTDQQRVRPESEPFVERRDDGDIATEADDVLGATAGPRGVDDRRRPAPVCSGCRRWRSWRFRGRTVRRPGSDSVDHATCDARARVSASARHAQSKRGPPRFGAPGPRRRPRWSEGR